MILKDPQNIDIYLGNYYDMTSLCFPLRLKTWAREKDPEEDETDTGTKDSA